MWVRLDDSTPNHPKFVRAGPEAFGLFVAGLCYCNRYGTDGLIPKAAVPHLLPGISRRRAMEIAERLGANGSRPSWVDEGDHYRIHDYEVYQLPRDDGREQLKRELAAERKRRQRARERDQSVTVTRDGHGAVTRDGHAVARDGHTSVACDGHALAGDGHAPVTRDGHAPLPEPLPPTRPVLNEREFSNAPAREAERDLGGEFRVWYERYPRQEGEIPALHAWLAASDLPPLPELLAALEAQKGANATPKYWRKPERYLRELGWRDQPLPPPAPGRAGRPARHHGARGSDGGAWEDR
jgi:hypothetical protein